MGSTNDYLNNLDRLDQWLKDSTVPAAAVFDIGSRSARVMVGPKRLPGVATWTEQTFFTAGFVTALGSDVIDRRLSIEESAGLGRLAQFIADTLEILHANGLTDENIIAVGTEVFRSLDASNARAIIEWLKQETGLSVQIISGKTEARLALFGAFMTYKRGLPAESWLDEKAGETLLLLDQGGGSTEVSTAWSQAKATVVSRTDLGTTALKEYFFATDENGRPIEPESNHASIDEQHKRLLAHIESHVSTLDLSKTFKIIYGMGSALTACFPGISSWQLHNKLVKVELLERIERDTCQNLRHSYPTVALLHHALQTEGDDNRRGRRDKEALILYGLPVYRMILKHIGAREIRVSGFPLRYGVFIVWHHAGWGFDFKKRDVSPSES